jgi:hypothetical protein
MSKRKTNQEAEATTPETQAAAVATLEREPGHRQDAEQPASATDGPSLAARQPGDEPAEKSKRQFNPVFGFTSRFAGPLKYRKFTDANLKIIAFKFNLANQEKLPPEALEIMREYKQDRDGNPTGLEFKQTRTHGKIWQIPNDVEGRTLADKIDMRLSEIAEKLQEAQGKTPF